MKSCCEIKIKCATCFKYEWMRKMKMSKMMMRERTMRNRIFETEQMPKIKPRENHNNAQHRGDR